MQTQSQEKPNMSTSATIPIQGEERFVDAKELASYLGFESKLVLRLAHRRTIPSLSVRYGARTYFRFKIAEVVEALRTKDTPQNES